MIDVSIITAVQLYCCVGTAELPAFYCPDIRQLGRSCYFGRSRDIEKYVSDLDYIINK